MTKERCSKPTQEWTGVECGRDQTQRAFLTWSVLLWYPIRFFSTEYPLFLYCWNVSGPKDVYLQRFVSRKTNPSKDSSHKRRIKKKHHSKDSYLQRLIARKTHLSEDTSLYKIQNRLKKDSKKTQKRLISLARALPYSFECIRLGSSSRTIILSAAISIWRFSAVMMMCSAANTPRHACSLSWCTAVKNERNARPWISRYEFQGRTCTGRQI